MSGIVDEGGDFDDELAAAVDAAAEIERAKQAEVVTEEEECVMLANAEEFLSKNNVVMLSYQKQMFLDLVYMDGLAVCAKGISYDKAIINLLNVYCDPGNLILIINYADYEEKHLKSQIDRKHVHESSTNANEREQIYLMGGIQFVTTRILVVDLLKKRIPIELITGIIVMRAHQIIESCQEAFALRLYRQSNKTGFIKAFSNSPESFTYGYGHVEKVMRNLFVKDLFIWPRFHAVIQKSLKPYEPQVIELHIPMTQKMTSIQTHLLELMNYLVKEVKRINRFVDMDEITVENCVTKKFHKILQSQLDSIWHQLNSQTKMIISDLKVLRSLMISTMYSDAVSAYVTMKKYRTQTYAMNNSGWILLDSAEQIFKLSKERVYNSKDEFEPEFCPKWETLSEILRNEIPSQIIASISHKPHVLHQPIKVLVLCQDSRTCHQLNQYLTQGGERYLLFTAMKNDVTIGKVSEKYTKIREADGNSLRIQNAMDFIRPPTTPSAAIPLKQTTITAAVATTSTQSAPTANESSTKKPTAAPKKGGFLRDRIAKRKADNEDPEFTKKDAVDETVCDKDDLELLTTNEDVGDCTMFRESYFLTMTQPISLDNIGDLTISSEITAASAHLTQNPLTFESFAEMENMNLTAIVNTTTKPIVCIQTFKSCEDSVLSLDRSLREMNPGFIILYHSNVTAIRQIEVYEAEQKRHPRDRLNVYFLVHSQTVEEQSYLTSLRREKEAFDLLIKTKQTMVVPEYQDGKSDDTFLQMKGLSTAAEIDGAPEAATSTRQGDKSATKAATAVSPKIIVDMREFRSDLPCLIHRRGIEIVPVTITIGDYILTPDICVERKSISDLIGSLNSGRLYTQCVQMTRYYKKPLLLIEFDQNKPFHLQRHYMISGESTSNIDITQKLQLLTIYFTKLRLVWSPSPYATAQLFEELKHGHDEPDPIVASQIGSTSATKELDNFVDRINPNIYDFLLKLPGINLKNVNTIIRNVKNLKELVKLSEEELAKLLDSKANAKLLWEIIHVNHKPVKPTDDKPFPSKYGRNRGRMF